KDDRRFYCLYFSVSTVAHYVYLQDVSYDQWNDRVSLSLPCHYFYGSQSMIVPTDCCKLYCYITYAWDTDHNPSVVLTPITHIIPNILLHVIHIIFFSTCHLYCILNNNITYHNQSYLC